MESFYDELKDLLNRYSKENESNTPDFLLASYLMDCLATFSATMKFRDAWWNCDDDKESVVGCDNCGDDNCGDDGQI